jgi:hypothetical protein
MAQESLFTSTTSPVSGLNPLTVIHLLCTSNPMYNITGLPSTIVVFFTKPIIAGLGKPIPCYSGRKAVPKHIRIRELSGLERPYPDVSESNQVAMVLKQDWAGFD